MSKHDVTIRDVRNHGREVIERVLAGEHLTVTRAGRPVAELRPVPRPALPADELLLRWQHLPSFDARRLRSDIDEIMDPLL
ncbi:MAG: type II toxin-antitoxin system prevent-host-death family antitoxin [Trueperaceae bacterium]|nr:type II toxin-antitoxin system prevent-host-death family antitoxin [Trueperaceae bacterium]